MANQQVEDALQSHLNKRLKEEILIGDNNQGTECSQDHDCEPDTLQIAF